MNSEFLFGGALIFANTALKPLFLLVIELHVISQITLATCLELAVITRIRYPKMYGLVLFEIIFVCEILSAVIAKKDRPRQLKMYYIHMFLEVVFINEYSATLFARVLHTFMYALFVFLEI